MRAARPTHPDLTMDLRVPAATRLRAPLQNASGGPRGGGVYGVDEIVRRLA